jgi:hypothetical protein
MHLKVGASIPLLTASLPESAQGLRQGITLEHLRDLATALSDVQAAEELSEARAALFKRVPTRTG